MNQFDNEDKKIREDSIFSDRNTGLPEIDKSNFAVGKAIIGIAFTVIVIVLIASIFQFDDKSSIDGYDAKEANLKSLIKSQFLFYDDGKTYNLEGSDYDKIVDSLEDPYSAYLDEEEVRLLKEETEGRFFGIGVKFVQNANKEVIIDEVFENSAAEESGLLKGDKLISVENVKVGEKPLGEVVKNIRGKEGTRVELEFYRESEKKTIRKNIQRKEVKVSSVSFNIIEGNVGYIKISEFTDSSDEDFENAIMKLRAKGARSFVIDLRNNPGGLVRSTVEMLDYILPSGKLVYTKSRSGMDDKQWFSDEEHQIHEDVVVLMNGNSASASEIFAGAIQDFGKGKIVGEQSYGKGIIQQIFNLGDGTAVKLTTAEYFTPKDQKIHKKGVTPDIEVKQDVNSKEDLQLKKAIEILKGK